MRANDYLRQVMVSLGLEKDMWEAEKERANLIGICPGTGGRRSLVLNGHVDFVSEGPIDDWTEAGPWSGLVKDDRIWQRGSCDMKGGFRGD